MGQIAILVAIPLALSLTLGAILPVSIGVGVYNAIRTLFSALSIFDFILPVATIGYVLLTAITIQFTLLTMTGYLWLVRMIKS